MKRHLPIFIGFILLLSGLFYWQYEVAQNACKQWRSDLELAFGEIEQEIEENATCYRLYKEVSVEKDGAIYVLLLDSNGNVDTLSNYLGVMGPHAKNFEESKLGFATNSQVDIDMRVEFRRSESPNPTPFQYWVDTTTEKYLTDMRSGISLGDSLDLLAMIDSKLPAKGQISWVIYNSNEEVLIKRGRPVQGNTDTLTLFENRMSTFTSPFNLVVKSKSPGIISLITGRWETWMALVLVALLMAVLIQHQSRLNREKEILAENQRSMNFISHEFNTQVAKINMAIESMEMAEGKDEEQQLKQLISKGGEQLSKNVRQLLSLSESKHNNSSEPVDLVQLAAEFTRDEAKVQLVEAPEELVISSNRNVLDTALSNLVQNAAKYGGPEIELSVRKNGDKAVLSVWDNGPGVESKELQNITKAWYRANSKTQEGFGLGLHYVQRIAKDFKGQLTLENTQEPRGFRASLYLPLA